MEVRRGKLNIKEDIIYKIYSYFDIYDLARFQRISKRWRMYLYEIPMPIFENISIDFTQSLTFYNQNRLKRYLLDQNPGMEDIINEYNDNIDNDVTEDGFEIGPKWRGAQLHLLSEQIYQQVHFIIEIASKKQIIKSISLNFNNTDICDDDYIFSTAIKCIRYFLIAVGNICKTVEKLEVTFLRSNRNEKNELYADEIKTFLEAIGESDTLKDSMKVLKFDSYCTEIMIGLIAGFYNLEELKISDCIFLEGEYFPIVKTNCLKKLNLSGSHQVESSHIQMLVENNSETLRSVKLDGEGMDGEELTEIIEKLNILEELCIYYGNSASSELLKVLLKHNQTLEKLVIRKNDNFLEQDLLFFFNNQFPVLHTLILDECTHLDTECVKKIAVNCTVLKSYSSEWCVKIDSTAIEHLLLNCCNLEKISLSGIKTINDSVFSKLFEINETRLSQDEEIFPLKLFEINFKMCNYLSKPVLQQMKEYYPACTVIDYYGEEITKPRNGFTDYRSDL
ncbi:unnamed protein product [Moneuplotes crassus]|uniref:F-box domain-containing protein n=2 Tax=Euplotes crassus TaxID=5936 RepID=A0AAD1U8Y3_EUPCR|nr:unnamed protein product [Moneuplotes crassus]